MEYFNFDFMLVTCWFIIKFRIIKNESKYHGQNIFSHHKFDQNTFLLPVDKQITLKKTKCFGPRGLQNKYYLEKLE